MIVFETFDNQSEDEIEFEISLNPLGVEYPEEHIRLLTSNNEAPPASENNVTPPATVEEYDSDEDDSYEVDKETGEDNEVSLDEQLCEEGVDFFYCDPDGDDTVFQGSSDDDNRLTRMAKYCTRHQWAPNSNGSIELKEGQVFGNAKLIRATVNGKIKNDSCRYTVTCKNDACDWRLHASRLPDRVTYMIKSVCGGHSFCRKVVENKEANVRWVASVLQTTIHSNPMIEVKTLRNELQDRSGVRCDRLTLYRAKKIVLKTMKADHVDSYAKLKKYGNAIRLMNPGTWWPKATNRYCFRHMLANFNCAFKNHTLNGKLWHTARVGSAADFKEALKWVGEDSVDVVNWLMSEPIEKWARHAFDSRIKSDHVTNNISESFNRWIKDEKDKPILTLLELLRRKIMIRFAEKWDELEKWNDSITPYAREQLIMNEKEARKLEVIHGRGEWYETLEPCGKKNLVNTGDVYCDCGMWQISGIPYMHVVAVLMYNRQFAHEHVHWYYSKEAMKLTYSGSINPIPDESRWPEIEHDDRNANEVVEPPHKRAKVDRPKKARRRVADEPRAPRKTFSNKCKGCNSIGHNIRTCPYKKICMEYIIRFMLVILFFLVYHRLLQKLETKAQIWNSESSH
ncbi:hypothetical protein ACOSP7_012172 [Xanthoceras sorbifolium]